MHVNAIVQTAAAHADVERQGVKRSTSWRDEDCDAPKRSRRVGTADLDSEFAQLDLYHETRERGVVLDHLYALEDLNQVSSNPQVLEVRRATVYWLAGMAKALQLYSSTMHTALNYLDRVWATAHVKQDRVLEVAAACLLIAAKFDERPDRAPLISEYVAADPQRRITAAGVASSELLILQHLGWRMRVATRLHFLGLYRDLGLFTAADRLDGRAPSHAERTFADGYAKFFCDLACQDPDLMRFPASTAAAAAAAAARDVAGIVPVWPEELEERLGMYEADIAACYSSMCAAFRRDFAETSASARGSFGAALSSCGGCRTETPVLSTAAHWSKKQADSPTNVAMAAQQWAQNEGGELQATYETGNRC